MMNINQFSIYHNNEELYLIEGPLEEVQTAETRVNLLERIDKRSRKKNLASGIAASVTEMHGLVAASASLVLYEGENMHNFAGMIDGQVICGVFAEGNRLQSGDTISAVVSRRGDVLYVHSLQRTSDGLLLLPLNTTCGEEAQFRQCMRCAWNMIKLLWVMVATLTIGYVAYESPGTGSYTFMALFTLFGPPLVMFPTELMTYRAMGGSADYAETIFKLYGIPRPSDFDAVKGMDRFETSKGDFIGINGTKALAEHRRKFKIKE